MNSETIGCAHEACHCVVTATLDPGVGDPEEAFCGDFCRDASTDEEEAACACGHPPCDEP